MCEGGHEVIIRLDLPRRFAMPSVGFEAIQARVLELRPRVVDRDITRLLIEWRHGHEAARDALLPLVYDELRRIASRQMARERDGHTLQPTALVHEAWMRLANAELDLKDRAHFLAIAARVMRQILVQYARGVNAEKRGAGVPRLELKEDLDVADVSARPLDCDLLALDDALVKLAAHDERKNHIVELKYFGGLTDKEIAEVVGVAIITVRRDLKVAHAFLHWQITGSEGPGPDVSGSAE
jgi:RNA polymerase sigma factor (TIGR02999 family)